ncbi:MAG: Mrp/NBP35 family ATP-binding protein, partial [Ignavibacteria bacterium]|nr:Mrp/NBP35 family ATP-binding protein [Ignavibacteria bacterium]
AKEMGVEFLGSLPIDIETRKAADEGYPIVLQNDSTDISNAMMKIVEMIENISVVGVNRPKVLIK